MNITELIVDFIKQGNVVEIPGMGTLTSSNVNAYHDSAQGTFYPARRTVVMNTQQNGNKAIVRCIAERECVTVEIAEQIWNNYVTALNDKLKENAEGHAFPGLGVLRLADNHAVFEAEEGLDLDASKRDARPLENVTTYTPKNMEDPFAIFDRPATPVEEPKDTDAEKIAAEKAAAEKAAAEKAAAEEEARRLSAEEEAKRQAAAEEASRLAAEEEAKRQAEEEARRTAAEEEEAKRQAEEEAKKKAEAEKRADKEAKEAAKEAKRARKENERNARKILKEAKKERKREAKKQHEKKKKKLGFPIILLIILVILCLLAVGGYLWYRHVPETHGTNNATHVELPPYSYFSRAIEGLEYSEGQIMQNKAQVNLFMRDYIRQYLTARHYNNAFAVVMDRIDEYADMRLHEFMGDDHYALIHFFPNNDYYRNFCYGTLQEFGGYFARCRVQKELMDEERLDQFLDALIAEMGLHPDGAVRVTTLDANAGANVKAQEPYVENVPAAPTFKASKQGYDIIAGFCTQKSKADKMANHLKSLGCDAYVINRSGLYYVSMGSAPTRTAAESLYNHIKSWYQGDITIKNFNE